MFVNLTRKNHPEDDKVRVQCVCGVERLIAEHRDCPACGKMLPRAVSVDGGAWIPYPQFKIDQLRQTLASDALDQVPPEHREMARNNLAEQIRRLQDGTWVTEARERLGHCQRMLQPEALEKFPPDQRPTMQKHLESQLQMLREELEAVGQPATPINLFEDIRNGGPRPEVARQQWDKDPLKVLQKASLAITMHLTPEAWSPPQRCLVHAWFYGMAVKEGGGGHSQIFFNATPNHATNTGIQITPEELSTVCTPAHAAVFEKALDRWHSKPRACPPCDVQDPEKHAAWVRDTIDPIRAEFRDLDEEACRLRPTIESCLVTYLRAHQDEFVDVEEEK